MLTTDQLAEVALEPASKLRTWQARGIIQPESRSGWTLPESLWVALYCDLLRDRQTVEQTAAEALTMVKAIGAIIRTATSDQPAPLEKITFVTAKFADGEAWHRVATTDADLTTLVGAILRRKPVHLELRDVTAMYLRTLEAFQAARAEPRQRELA